MASAQYAYGNFQHPHHVCSCHDHPILGSHDERFSLATLASCTEPLVRKLRIPGLLLVGLVEDAMTTPSQPNKAIEPCRSSHTSRPPERVVPSWTGH